MKVIIADDEALARQRLRSLLGELEGVEVVGEAANGKQALLLSNDLTPDIILLDIRMPLMDGLEAARHLGTLEDPPAVIFTTAYSDHALAAFEAHAVDYLLKPIRKERLAHALDKASKLNRAQRHAVTQASAPIGNDTTQSTHRARTHISARIGEKIQLVAVPDIIYFQADSKYVTVRFAASGQTGQVLIEASLKSLEEEFAGRFTRIHRNALVAQAHISGMIKSKEGHHEITLRGIPDQLEISRSHLSAVKKLIALHAA